MSTFGGSPYKGNLNFNSLGNPNKQGKVYLQEAIEESVAPIIPLAGADLILGFSKYVTTPPAGFAANIFDPVGLGNQNIGFNDKNYFDETGALAFLAPGTSGEVLTLPDQTANGNDATSTGTPTPSLTGNQLTPTGLGSKRRVAFSPQNIGGSFGLENTGISAALALTNDFVIHVVARTPTTPGLTNLFYLSNAAQTEFVRIRSINIGAGSIVEGSVTSATPGGTNSVLGLLPVPASTDIVISFEVGPVGDPNVRLYFNGVFQNVNPIGPGLALAPGDTYGVGFNQVTGGDRWFANIGAVIVQSGVGAIAQIPAVVSMLRGRFGI